MLERYGCGAVTDIATPRRVSVEPGDHLMCISGDYKWHQCLTMSTADPRVRELQEGACGMAGVPSGIVGAPKKQDEAEGSSITVQINVEQQEIVPVKVGRTQPLLAAVTAAVAPPKGKGDLLALTLALTQR